MILNGKVGHSDLVFGMRSGFKIKSLCVEWLRFVPPWLTSRHIHTQTAFDQLIWKAQPDELEIPDNASTDTSSVIFVNATKTKTKTETKLKWENRKRLETKTKKLKMKTKMPKQQNMSLNKSARIQYGTYGCDGCTALNLWLTVDSI